MTVGHDTRNWLIHYKLYHIPFWGVYNYFCWVITVGNPVKAINALLYLPYTVKYLFYVMGHALAASFNLYFLFPRYLEKSRFAVYTLLTLLTCVCAACLIVPGYYVSAWLAHSTPQKLFGKDACIFTFFSNAFLSTLAAMTLAMSIKLAKNWLESRRRQQLLEKEKLETELNYLRYQFNPHFLFNTINSIFFLIHKNPDMASASLAKFSELLRYQLYECNDEQIPLASEITYLENFIGLEQLRQSNTLGLTIDVQQQDTGQVTIAPFLLMTFVENAFKHVSRHTDEPNWITVKGQLHHRQLDFFIANSSSPFESNDVLHYRGIGLKNVQRRLDLLYPDRHQLSITNHGGSFEVRLRLQLAQNQQK
ncbi:sensor histidine kinase [Puia dinghuensis]|uniref:Histidine kinase n=1 Tax=Puia dinghuensis TaxID=1792502 RepID=A0A8J2U720_9BACT|nr:histidine kinase [Puia dinghuensis]GGA83343.1 histidine kinase [Puia dinghuensis]